jgi:Tfp pilus assembly protein PilO
MKLDFLRRVPKDKLQKIVLVCIITLCTVVATTQFYVLKSWTAWRDTKSRITKLNEQIQDTEHKVKQAAQNEAYREQVRSFAETQQAGMVSGDPFAWVVREISLLAEKHPVHVLGLHPGDKPDSTGKTKYLTYNTRIEVTGTYDQIGVFIRDLENQFPTGEIRTFALGAVDANGQHQASLNLALLMQSAQSAKKVEGKKTI